MFRLMFSIAALLVTSSCAHQPKPVAYKPDIKSIAIIPATDPTAYTLENVSAVQFVIPLAATVNYMDSKEKAKQFNAKMLARQVSLGPIFIEAVASSLRSYGYQVQILEGISRPPDDIDDVDYEKVSTTADAVLHLRFKEVGLFSPRGSVNYLPRVNANGTLFVIGRQDSLYDEDIYYGVDARKGNAWAIDSDEKFAYRTFEAVMANLDEISNAFEVGTREVSRRVSERVRESIK